MLPPAGVPSPHELYNLADSKSNTFSPRVFTSSPFPVPCLFQLTVSKGKEKATVTTLEPAVLSAPPRIRIFDPCYEPDPTRPVKQHKGVLIMLLDYISL